jgi:aminoglycoside phosphotransferase family enzyme/predicted kinase
MTSLPAAPVHPPLAPPARPDEGVVLGAMCDPATYGEAVEHVEFVETHGSRVFLAGDRAYKVKKPVVLPFLDFGTPERRRELCREEVRLNRRLAPRTYLGTVVLVRRDGRFVLVPDDDAVPDALEAAVEMRRFAPETTLAAHIRAGTATATDAVRLGQLLRHFHAIARRERDVDGATRALRAAVDTTLDDLETRAMDGAGAQPIAALRRFLVAALTARAPDLARRGGRGLVCDGHGDLRAEHVLLTEPPEIVDCLEFDPSLRIADVAVELSFLVMDLEALGAPEFGRRVVAAYRDAGGDPGDDALLAVFACYRALVRAKVAAVLGDDDAGERFVALAERFAWRARGPLLLLCAGPPASGKSTLAAALAQQSGLPHLSSDVVRKRLLNLPPAARAPSSAYAPEVTERVYTTLGAMAAAAVNERGGAIVDATFGTGAARAEFGRGLGRCAAPLLFAECRAPAPLLEARAAERARRPDRVSDATAEVVRRWLAEWEPPAHLPWRHRLIVHTDLPPEGVLDHVLAWLDRRLEDRA